MHVVYEKGQWVLALSKEPVVIELNEPLYSIRGKGTTKLEIKVPTEYGDKISHYYVVTFDAATGGIYRVDLWKDGVSTEGVQSLELSEDHPAAGLFGYKEGRIANTQTSR